jgi:hypothetical protein
MEGRAANCVLHGMYVQFHSIHVPPLAASEFLACRPARSELTTNQAGTLQSLWPAQWQIQCLKVPSVQAGLTSLFTASMSGHLDVVRLLLDSKADANLADQVQYMVFYVSPIAIPTSTESHHLGGSISHSSSCPTSYAFSPTATRVSSETVPATRPPMDSHINFLFRLLYPPPLLSLSLFSSPSLPPFPPSSLTLHPPSPFLTLAFHLPLHPLQLVPFMVL